MRKWWVQAKQGVEEGDKKIKQLVLSQRVSGGQNSEVSAKGRKGRDAREGQGKVEGYHLTQEFKWEVIRKKAVVIQSLISVFFA